MDFDVKKFGDELFDSFNWLSSFPKDQDLVSGKDKHEFRLQLREFKPENISVKLSDGYVVVEGSHEESKGEGFLARKFVRRFLLPSDSQKDSLESRFSPEGILTITAKRVAGKKDTVIPVTYKDVNTKSKL